MKPIHIFLISSISLAACQEVSETGETPAPDSITATAQEHYRGALPDGLTIEYDEGAETITVTRGGNTRVLAPYLDNPSLKGFLVHVIPQNTWAAVQETDSGAGYAKFGFSRTGELNFAGSIYGRNGNTTLVQSGSATFTGSYGGFIAFSDGNRLNRLIEGDVELNADFETLEISGEITNRVFGAHDPLMLNAKDLILAPTTIDANLAFSGATSGGDLTGIGGTSSAGIYSGLLVGADGKEIVGGLSLSHVVGGIDYTEVGAFVGASE